MIVVAWWPPEALRAEETLGQGRPPMGGGGIKDQGNDDDVMWYNTYSGQNHELTFFFISVRESILFISV